MRPSNKPSASVSRPTADQLLNFGANTKKRGSSSGRVLTSNSGSALKETDPVMSRSISEAQAKVDQVRSYLSGNNSGVIPASLKAQEVDSDSSDSSGMYIPTIKETRAVPKKLNIHKLVKNSLPTSGGNQLKLSAKKPVQKTRQPTTKQANKPEPKFGDGVFNNLSKNDIQTALLSLDSPLPKKAVEKTNYKRPTVGPKVTSSSTGGAIPKTYTQIPKAGKSSSIPSHNIARKEYKKTKTRKGPATRQQRTKDISTEDSTSEEDLNFFKVTECNREGSDEQKKPRSTETASSIETLVEKAKLQDEDAKLELSGLINDACEGEEKRQILVLVINRETEIAPTRDDPEVLSTSERLIKKISKVPKYEEDLVCWMNQRFPTYTLSGKNEGELVNVMMEANRLDLPFVATKSKEGLVGIVALFGRLVNVQDRELVKFA